jgi:hypothetical protein
VIRAIRSGIDEMEFIFSSMRRSKIITTAPECVLLPPLVGHGRRS